jgi:UDP-glucose 4-epimerase
MKKVLITGASGFIGSYLKEHLTGFEISTLSLRDPSWKRQPIDADVVIHCAGLAHSKNHSKENYYDINSSLTTDFAIKCKDSGVKLFIFFSTIHVYGSSMLSEISIDTKEKPTSDYAASKLDAEKNLRKVQDADFAISILRLPIVYDAVAKGNMQILLKVYKHIGFVFDFENIKSIMTLQQIKNEVLYRIEIGSNDLIPLYFENISTSNLIKRYRSELDKKTLIIKLPLIFKKLLSSFTFFKKAYGDFYYLNDHQVKL